MSPPNCVDRFSEGCDNSRVTRKSCENRAYTIIENRTGSKKEVHEQNCVCKGKRSLFRMEMRERQVFPELGKLHFAKQTLT